jgi:nucleoside-diphosphate-sugar epimerase
MNMLITGGAGFIGINAAGHFIKKGWSVTLFDNFSRKGTDVNATALNEEFAGKFDVVKGDIRYDRDLLEREVSETDAVLHLAAEEVEAAQERRQERRVHVEPASSVDVEDGLAEQAHVARAHQRVDPTFLQERQHGQIEV